MSIVVKFRNKQRINNFNVKTNKVTVKQHDTRTVIFPVVSRSTEYNIQL